MMQQKAVRLPIKLIEEIEAIANETEHTPSDIMRLTIERGIREIRFMRDLNLNCLDSVARNLPPLLKYFLFEHAAMNIMIEDILKEKMPAHDHFAMQNSFNERVVKRMQSSYFK